MNARPQSEWLTDEQILEILALHDVDGLSFAEVGKRVGKTRSAIAGLKRRVNWDTDMVDETPELNGTLPARWWKR